MAIKAAPINPMTRTANLSCLSHVKNCLIILSK
jgi:hypothetical protein